MDGDNAALGADLGLLTSMLDRAVLEFSGGRALETVLPLNTDVCLLQCTASYPAEVE